jgi:hypothetical protein
VLGGLLTSRAFLNRFPQVDILDPAQTSFHDAWVTGMLCYLFFSRLQRLTYQVLLLDHGI